MYPVPGLHPLVPAYWTIPVAIFGIAFAGSPIQAPVLVVGGVMVVVRSHVTTNHFLPISAPSSHAKNLSSKLCGLIYLFIFGTYTLLYCHIPSFCMTVDRVHISIMSILLRSVGIVLVLNEVAVSLSLFVTGIFCNISSGMIPVSDTFHPDALHP